jgi:diguanylate cyclase (GGDEF)-like protein
MTPEAAGPPVLDPSAEDTWLIDHAVRARLHEVSGRPRTARQVVFVLELLVLLACVPELGWWPVATLPVVVAAFLGADRAMRHTEHAELVYAAAWSLAQAVVAAAAAVTGGPDSPLLMWLGIPIATGVGRFTPRGLAAGVALTTALLLGATLGVDAQRVIDAPYLVAFPLGLVSGIALVGSALMRSEVEHRADAIVDPLTQMLNRKALAARGRELALQSAVSGRPVAVELGDLDHFKAVNDRQGHQAGDAVLREVAYRWRTTLRAYDLAYRIGGEEFVVLLPGATEEEASELAEKLRAAVRGEPIAGLQVTMSFGVAVSGAGGFDLDAHYARADEALYEAKRRGRDRVVLGAAVAADAAGARAGALRAA